MAEVIDQKTGEILEHEQNTKQPDEFYWPNLTEKEQPKSTIGNLRALLKFYDIKVTYDSTTKEILYQVPPSAYLILYGKDQPPSQENEQAVNKAAIKSLCIELGLPSSITQYLIVLADQGWLMFEFFFKKKKSEPDKPNDGAVFYDADKKSYSIYSEKEDKLLPVDDLQPDYYFWAQGLILLYDPKTKQKSKLSLRQTDIPGKELDYLLFGNWALNLHDKKLWIGNSKNEPVLYELKKVISKVACCDGSGSVEWVAYKEEK